MAGVEGNGLIPVPRLGHDFHVRLQVQGAGEANADDEVVIDDEQADLAWRGGGGHARAPTGAGPRAGAGAGAVLVRAGASGTVSAISVPSPGRLRMTRRPFNFSA